MTEQQVRIFTSNNGQAQLEVALDQETVWLSQAQMAELFDKDVRTVNEHIGNVFTEGELEREPTIRKFRIVRQEGKREVQRNIEHYNLDVIISVGYRVKSQNGVQFRRWATQVLKDHLVQGYTINQRRLTERGIEFEQAVNLLSRTLTNQGLASNEGEAIARVIGDYARSWSLLQGYDEQHLGGGTAQGLNPDETACHDALASNESAMRELGDDTLKKIAVEITGQHDVMNDCTKANALL